MSDVAEAVWSAAQACRAWAAAQRAELRAGEPITVLAAIRALSLAEARDAAAAGQAQEETLKYLEPRLAQMRYAHFRAQGLPIGSGIVESANKLVVEAQLKGAGRRWAEAKVNALLALRGVLCSERWAEAWPAGLRDRRQERDQPHHPSPRQLPRRPPAPPRSAELGLRRCRICLLRVRIASSTVAPPPLIPGSVSG